MSYVEIRGLKKRFGDNVVLDGVDLDMGKGEVVAIIGPSGTGKSTLLRTLNRLEVPEEGTLAIDGEAFDLTAKKTQDILRLRQNTEMVFQQFHLFQHETVLQNVMEGLITVKKLGKQEARSIALRELAHVDMLDKIKHYPRHLSGGQQQRVAIARALAMRPKLLLMDEPTSALDPELTGEVLMTIRKVAQEGNTILLVTHEMSFVRNVAHRIIFLEKGKIVAQGTPRDIFEHPENPRLIEFLRKINELDTAEYYI